MVATEPKVRYSDEELEEFRTMINDRIAKETEEMEYILRQIKELNESGFNQQGDFYDDTSIHTELDMLSRMSARKQLFIGHLRNALHRIANKTYGICQVTGQLIDKKRLTAVPHATKSVEGKTLDHTLHPSAEMNGDGKPGDDSKPAKSGSAFNLDRADWPGGNFNADVDDASERRNPMASERMLNDE